MSAVFRAPRQVDSQVTSFIANDAHASTDADAIAFYPAQLETTVTADVSGVIVSRIGSIINTSNATMFLANLPGTGRPAYAVGDQFRDLGKSLVVQTSYENSYVYKLVQTIGDNATTNTPRTFYALVSGPSSGAVGVHMVRSGY